MSIENKVLNPDEEILLESVPQVDYGLKKLEEFLEQGEKGLIRARENELRYKNPLLTDQMIEQILFYGK